MLALTYFLTFLHVHTLLVARFARSYIKCAQKCIYVHATKCLKRARGRVNLYMQVSILGCTCPRVIFFFTIGAHGAVRWRCFGRHHPWQAPFLSFFFRACFIVLFFFALSFSLSSLYSPFTEFLLSNLAHLQNWKQDWKRGRFAVFVGLC